MGMRMPRRRPRPGVMDAQSAAPQVAPPPAGGFARPKMRNMRPAPAPAVQPAPAAPAMAPPAPAMAPPAPAPAQMNVMQPRMSLVGRTGSRGGMSFNPYAMR